MNTRSRNRISGNQNISRINRGRRRGRRNRNRSDQDGSIKAEFGEMAVMRTFPPTQPKPKLLPAKPLMRELKFNDSTVANAAAVSTTATISSLSGVTQGTTEITRVGDSIQYHSLELRSFCISGDTTNAVRIIVFQWLQDDNVYVPAVADILQNTAANLATVSPVLHDNNAKFHVLLDHRFDVGTAGNVIAGYNVIQTRFHAPQCEFNAGAATGVNKCYILLVSDSAAVTHPALTCVVRINWFDN